MIWGYFEVIKWHFLDISFVVLECLVSMFGDIAAKF